MYKEVIIGWFKHFDFLLLDAGLLEVSLIIAYWLRHGFGGVPPLYQNAMWAILVIHICAVFFLSSYKGIIRRGYLVELKKVIEHCTFVTVGMLCGCLLFRNRNRIHEWLYFSCIRLVFSLYGWEDCSGRGL